jgi:hypothetical protein
MKHGTAVQFSTFSLMELVVNKTRRLTLMLPQLDIFKLDKDGSVVWKEAAENLEVANSSVKLLATSSPGSYMLFSQATATKPSLCSTDQKRPSQNSEDAPRRRSSVLYRLLSAIFSRPAQNEARGSEIRGKCQGLSMQMRRRASNGLHS